MPDQRGHHSEGEDLQLGLMRVLELIIQDVPLSQVLTAAIETIEGQSRSGMIGSIQVLDSDGLRLRHCAAPSLPESYNNAIDGLLIGPEVGSCGTAAYLKQQVRVSDIAKDPLWSNLRGLAASHGLGTCWSTPIMSKHGEVLGTFAIYYRQPCDPPEEDLQLVAVATRTAAIAIERKRANDALRASEQKYRNLFTMMDDGYCLFEKVQGEQGEPLDFRYVDTNPAFTAHTGVSGVIGKTIRTAFPGDVEEWIQTYERVLRTGEPERFERGIPGQDRIWEGYAFRLQDEADGRVAVFFKDVTERKSTEAKLRDTTTRLNSTLAAAEIATWTWDIPNDCLIMDLKAAQWFSIPPEDAGGAPISQYLKAIHPGDLPHVTAAVARALDGLPYEMEYRLVQPDGSHKWVVARGRVEHDEQGRPVSFPGLLIDITERKKTEEALRESRAVLKFTLESTQVGDWDLDLVHDTSRRSLRHDQCFGYQEPIPESEWGFNRFIEHVHPEDREQVKREFREAIEQRKPWKFECRITWPDGSMHWIAAHGSIYGTEEGRPTRMLGTVMDITERKQVEEALRKNATLLQLATEAAELGIFIWQFPEGQITFQNERACDIFGLSREAGSVDAEHLLSNIVHPEDSRSLREQLARAVRSDSRFHWEGRCYCPDGRMCWLEMTGRMENAPGGTSWRLTGTIADITERKRADEDLLTARDQALGASRAKSAFLANISHELRTPLNAIIGYSEMVAEELSATPQEHLAADVKKIEHSGRHLLALINDILDLSKVEAGKMEIHVEEFEVAPLLRELIEVVRPLAEKNENELLLCCREEQLGTARTDGTKIRQVLLNLLANAVKFTRNGRVTLEASREAGEGGPWLILRVSDTGIGISQDQQNLLFQEFTQLDPSYTRTYGGTGLGLAISRRFCRLVGGDITVESELGSGSVFTVRLPVETNLGPAENGQTPMAEPSAV